MALLDADMDAPFCDYPTSTMAAVYGRPTKPLQYYLSLWDVMHGFRNHISGKVRFAISVELQKQKSFAE